MLGGKRARMCKASMGPILASCMSTEQMGLRSRAACLCSCTLRLGEVGAILARGEGPFRSRTKT